MASSAQVQKFIGEIAPLIQKYAKERGYKVCSTVIAQACCESAYGTCALSKYHNYFGMKCGSGWKGGSVNMSTKEEYIPGQLTSIKDNFRTYSSMEEGVKGYYDFISWNRYANLKSAVNYKQYAEYLKADGYATSSAYVNTLCSLVRTYNLDKYDYEDAVDFREEEVKEYSDAVKAIAYEVIDGKYGNYPQRKENLYKEIQGCVDAIVKGGIK